MTKKSVRGNRIPAGTRWRTTFILLWLAVALATPSFAGDNQAAQRLAEVAGSVEIGRGEPPKWMAAEAGAQLEPGDLIRTNAGGRARVLLSAGEVRIFENSMLRLPSAEQSESVRLESGGSIFDVIRRAGKIFEVESSEVVVSVKGTRFSVSVDPEGASVAVFRGLVGVRTPDATAAVETLVREGFALRGGAELPFALEPAPEGDPWGAWSEGRQLQRSKHARKSRKGLRAARTSVQRETDGKVLSHAARKNPKVAEKLRQMRDARAQQGADSPPASPAPGTPEESLPDRSNEGRIDLEDMGSDSDQPNMQDDLMDGTDGGGPDGAAAPDKAFVKLVRVQFHDLALEFKGGPNSGPIDLDPSDPGDDDLFAGVAPNQMRKMVRGAWKVLKEDHRADLAGSGGSFHELRPLFLQVLQDQGLDKDQAKAVVKKLAK